MVSSGRNDLASQADESTKWLLENRIPCGGTAIIAGKPKAGKTTLALAIGLAVARGAAVLGSSTLQGPVLYLGLEGSIPGWKRLLRSLGVKLEDEFFFHLGRAPQDAVQWLAESIKRHAPALVVIDPLQRFTRVKESNSYSEVSNSTDALIDLARESGAALMFPHHAGKSEKSDAIDAPIGSTAVAGAFDTVLVLKRSAERRTIQTIQRYGDDLVESVLVMDPETHLVSISGSKQGSDEGLIRDDIVAFLSTKTETVDEATIAENVEGRKGTRVTALRQLVESHEVTRTGDGKKGSPYLYQHSSSLVPGYGWEPENQNPKTAENGDKIRANFCSRASGVFT